MIYLSGLAEAMENYRGCHQRRFRDLIRRIAIIISEGNLTVVDLDKESFDMDKYPANSEIAIFDLRVALPR